MQITPSDITEEELIQAAELVPHLWVLQNEIVSESGQPIEFEKRSFLKAIYDDMSPKIAILKPPQIGATVMNCLKALYVAHELNKDIVYTLPTQSDVQDIVGGSFNRIIAQNPILMDWVHDHDTVEQKSVGANLIRFRGTFSPKQATMVPASLLVHDEVDSSDPEVLTLYQTRLEAQEREEDKWRWYFSHPSLSGHGVDVYWQQSDKKEWFIKCKNGHEQILQWPDSIDSKNEEYICKVCKDRIDDSERICGKWKATATGDFSGYHISQLMLYNKSAKDIIKAYQDPQKDKQYFYNYVLGLPYIGSDDRIDPSVVLRNCVDTTNDYYNVNDRVIIGADTGHGIHYVMRNQQGIFFYGHETEITASKDPYDVIRKHLNRFEKSVAIFDQGGDLIGVRKLQAEYPGRVFLVFYRKDRKSDEYVEWGVDDEFGTVRVDRNRQMTIMVEQMRDTGRYRLNGTKEEWAEFASHFGNIYREKVEVDSKPGKDDKSLYGNEYVWKRNGADHFCFIAGTKIKTIYGDINIEDVEVGTPVTTRKGWKMVYHAGKTKRDTRVLTAYFSNGSILTGTPDHPIITTNGKIRLDSITRHAKLYEWQKARKLYIKGLHIEGIRNLEEGKLEYISSPMELSEQKDIYGFISNCGLMPMVLFLRGLSYIIKMAIHSITKLQTWSVNRELFIKAITQRKILGIHLTEEEMLSIWRGSEVNLTRGLKPPRVKGISTLTPSKLLCWLNPKLLSVLSAILKRLHEAVGVVSFVRPFVHLVGLHENIEKKDVFNISVKDEAEYVANGILVSNCHATLYSDIGMQRFQGSQAKIFGGKSVMDGLRKAQIVSDGGVQLMWPK